MLGRILRAARLTGEDVVIEVGPGRGMLTRALARQARRVVAVEVDPRLVAYLRPRLSALTNVEIVEGDILTLPPASLGRGEVYKVVANIPYYITSAILRHFLEAEAKPQLMVVMVQREVAQAIAAPPGKMSLLSLSVQFYCHPRIVGYVPPRSFRPPPQVESAIVRLEVYPQPRVGVEAGVFFRAAAAGFTAPRKQLRNTLAQGLGLPPQEVGEGLGRVGIDPRRRPATLTLEEWAKVSQAFPQEGG